MKSRREKKEKTGGLPAKDAKNKSSAVATQANELTKKKKKRKGSESTRRINTTKEKKIVRGGFCVRYAEAAAWLALLPSGRSEKRRESPGNALWGISKKTKGAYRRGELGWGDARGREQYEGITKERVKKKKKAGKRNCRSANTVAGNKSAPEKKGTEAAFGENKGQPLGSDLLSTGFRLDLRGEKRVTFTAHVGMGNGSEPAF